MAHDNDLASAQVHRALEINSSRDEIIFILIVGYVCYSTITDGSGQHSAVVLFDVYVTASERIVTWMRFRSVLFKWGTLQFLIVVWNSLQHP